MLANRKKKLYVFKYIVYETRFQQVHILYLEIASVILSLENANFVIYLKSIGEKFHNIIVLNYNNVSSKISKIQWTSKMTQVASNLNAKIAHIRIESDKGYRA